MKLKVKQGIALTPEQLIEIADLVMAEPDLGWEYQYHYNIASAPRKSGVYDCLLEGEFGTYSYHVNVSKRLITIDDVNC